MRISDIMMSNGMMNSISKSREKIEKLSTLIANTTKVNKPSDAPESAAKILRLGTKFGQNDLYSRNIDKGLAFLDDTVLAMESVQSEVMGVLTRLTELGNATMESNYSSYAMQIDLALKSMIGSANLESDGKYIFGGTDHSNVPFGFTSDELGVETKISDISGNQLIKLSSNNLQKINFPGAEVFGTVLTAGGNLDSSSAIGTVYNVSNTIYNSSKEEYSFELTFTKTAADTYSLTYDILDNTSTSIYSPLPAPVEVKFNSSTGKIESFGDKKSPVLKINNSIHHIDLSFEMNGINVSASANSVSLSINQKTDIFNTLIRIRDDLKSGVKPSAEDEEMVKTFNKKLLDKITEAGNLSSQLLDSQELLSSQKSVLENLLSKEQDVDMAKAIMDLQNQDYLLQMAYKISASILPKSLLDYL